MKYQPTRLQRRPRQDFVTKQSRKESLESHQNGDTPGGVLPTVRSTLETSATLSPDGKDSAFTLCSSLDSYLPYSDAEQWKGITKKLMSWGRTVSL